MVQPFFNWYNPNYKAKLAKCFMAASENPTELNTVHIPLKIVQHWCSSGSDRPHMVPVLMGDVNVGSLLAEVLSCLPCSFGWKRLGLSESVRVWVVWMLIRIRMSHGESEPVGRTRMFGRCPCLLFWDLFTLRCDENWGTLSVAQRNIPLIVSTILQIYEMWLAIPKS